MVKSIIFTLISLSISIIAKDLPRNKDLTWTYTPKHVLERTQNEIPSIDAKKRWRPYAAREMLFHGTNTNWLEVSSRKPSTNRIVPPILHKPQASQYHSHRPNLLGMEQGELSEKIVSTLHSALFGMGSYILSILASFKPNKTAATVNICDSAAKMSQLPGNTNNKFKDLNTTETKVKSRERQISNESLIWIDEGRQMTLRVGQLLESASQFLRKDFQRELSVEEKHEFERQKLELKELQRKQEEFWHKVRHAVKYGV